MKYLSSISSDNCDVTFVNGTFTGDLTVDTNTLYVDSTNNRVGIGITNPAYPFSVDVDTTGLISRIYNTNADGQGLLIRAGSTSSSTRVLQLASSNDTKIMTVTSSGNVGIGTTNPGFKLHVDKNATGYIARIQGDTNNISFYDGGSSGIGIGTDANQDLKLYVNDSLNSGIVIKSTGNVGIGTTSPAYKLDIGNNTSETLRISAPAVSGSYGNLLFGSSQIVSQAARIQGIYGSSWDGSLAFSTQDAGAADGNRMTEKMRITSAGNVGIGTTTPQAKLDVVGNVKVLSGTSNCFLDVGRNENEKVTLSVNDNVIIFNAVQDSDGDGDHGFILDRTFQGTGANYFDIRKAGTSQLYINSSGNVGIGTTSPDANARLSVAGAGIDVESSTDSLRLRFYEGTTFRSGIQHVLNVGEMITNAAVGDLAIRANAGNMLFASGGSTERMRIDSTGNVGIGTQSPDSTLQIVGNNSTAGTLTLNDANKGPQRSHIHYGSNGDWYIRSADTDGKIIIQDNGGNVGIGTASPDSLLEIENNPAAQSQTRMLSLDNNPTSNQGSGYIEISSGSNNQAKTQIEQVSSGGYGLLGNQYIDTNIINRGLSASAHGNINFATGSSTSTTSIVMTIGGGSQKGNVGIGTANPSQKLEVNGGGSYPDIRISATGLTSRYLEIGMDGAVQHSIGAFGAGTYLTFKTVGTDRMVIDSTGNVGIGTTSPVQKMQIDGGSSNAYLHFSNTDTGATVSDGSDIGINESEDLVVWNREATNLRFATSNTERMRITSDGNVAINSTTTSGYRLYVNGSTWINGGTNFTDGVSIFRTQSGAAEVMRIASNGNVGIGTSSPSKKLHVAGDTQIDAQGTGQTLLLGRANGQPTIKANTDQSGHLILDSNAGHIYLNNYVNKNVYMVTGGGNVGIGTTNPSEKLDVAGNIQLNGNYLKLNEGTNAESRIVSSANYLEIIGNGPSAASGARMWLGKGGTVDSGFYVNGSQLFFRGLDSSTKMYINGTSGNVGIGTNSPQSKLQIESTGEALRFTRSGQETYRVIHGTSGLYFTAPNAGNLLFGITQNSDVDIFNTSGSVMFRADGSTGNVGIGTTSPDLKLHLAHSDSNNGLLLEHTSQASSYSILQNIRENEGLIWQRWINGVFNSNLMTLSYDGNVGIGTTSPVQKLHVSGQVIVDGGTGVASSGVLHVRQNGNGSDNGIAITSGNATSHRIWKDSSGGFNIGPSSDPDAFYQDLSGNVGIGTTAPTYKLDVYGSARIGGSNGDVDLVIEADADNSGENDNPRILLKQDGGLVQGMVGMNGDANIQLTGFASNSMYIRNTGYPVHIAAGTTLGLTVETDGDVIVPNGNVGIGTTSPQTELHVKGNNGWGEVRIEGQTFASGHGASLEFRSEGTALADIYANTSKDLILRTNGGTERVRITSSGNVGIGTTSPTAKLHVQGTSYFFDQSIFSDKVGIGTTSPAYKLDVSVASQHVARFTSTTADNGGLIINKSNASYNPNILLQAGGNTKWYILNASNDSDKFQLYESTGTTPRFTLTQDGNVGIGTTSPSEKLSVATDTDVSAEIGKAHVGYIGYSTYAGFSHIDRNATSDYALLQASNGETFLNAASGQSINFRVSNNTKMRINSSGNVGIGTTSPGAKLEVSSSGAEGILISKDTVNGTNSGRLFFETDTVSEGFSFLNSNGLMTIRSQAQAGATSGNTRVAINGSGNVGIGTTSPAQKLHVNSGTINQVARFESTDGTAYLSIMDNNTANSLQGIGSSGDNLTLYANNAERMRITSSGNVGIGTISPTTKLYVDAGESTFNRGNSDGAIARFRGKNAEQAVIGTVTSWFDSNVGIGTTSPNNKLDVRRTNSGIVAEFQSTAGTSDEYVDVKLISGNTTAGTYGTILRHQRVGTSGADFAILTNPTLTGTPVERFRITKDGNVGIGTTSPQKVFEAMSGTNNFVSVGVQQLGVGQWAGIHFGYRESNASYRKSAIVFERTDLTSNNAQGKIHILNGPQGGAGSATLADAKLTIAENGNVGIGTTSPTQKLSVAGKISSDSNNNYYGAWLDGNTSAGSDNKLGLGTWYNNAGYVTFIQSGTPHRLKIHTSNTADHITLQEDGGNVGIGTSSPSAKLHISNTSGDANIVLAGSSGQVLSIDQNSIKTTTASQIAIYTNSTVTNGLYINSAGNIGIGTTIPAAKLHAKSAGNATYILRGMSSAGTDLGGLYQSTAGDAEIYLKTSAVATNVRISSNNVTYFNGGNVGIGTS
jgi:hypothetical protein